MTDIVFYETFQEEEQLMKEALPNTLKVEFVQQTIQESGDTALSASLISIRTQSIIPCEWSSKLNGVLTRSTGYDHLVEYKEKTKTKAALGYLPEYCSRAVAEHAILMLLGLVKNIKVQLKNFDRFLRDGMTGEEMKDKNLLVVGVGRIGSEIVNVGRALGMNVRGVDLKKKVEGLKYVSLKEGVEWAHYVICALSLNTKTKNMMNYQAFQSATNRIVFVNISRGEISPAIDLKRLINEKKLSGLGLDVYEDEPLLAESFRQGVSEKNDAVLAIESLISRDNVIFTPHNAFNSKEALERKARLSAESISHFIKNQTFPHIV